jgi:hypothetical protein
MPTATGVPVLPALPPDEQLRRLQELTLEMTYSWMAAEWGATSTANFRAFLVTLVEDLNQLQAVMSTTGQ